MRAVFTSILISFLLVACGAVMQPATPTVTATIPLTSTSTPTETPTATFTPESQLPEGELRNLEQRLKAGEFTLTETQEKDPEGNSVYQIIDEDKQPVSDIKIFQDGSSESKILFNDQEFNAVVPLQTISVKEGVLIWSGWKIENGEKVIFSSSAETIQDDIKTNNVANLSIIEGHSKEKQMIDTMRLHTKMSYGDPYVEYRGIKIGDKEISEKDIEPSEMHIIDYRIFKDDEFPFPALLINGADSRRHQKQEYYYHNPTARPVKFGLTTGYTRVNVYIESGEMEIDAIKLPVLILNTDGKVQIGTALLPSKLFNDSLTRNLTPTSGYLINPVVMAFYVEQTDTKYNRSIPPLGKFIGDRNALYIANSPYAADPKTFGTNILKLEPDFVDNVIFQVNNTITW